MSGGMVSAVLTVSLVRARPHALRLVAPLAFLLGVAVLKEAIGPSGSGVAALVLLPVLWVAARGSRGEVAIVVAGVGAVFIVPSLVLDGARDVGSRWQVAAFVAAAAAIAGAVVQHLVGQVRDQAREAVQRQRELEMLLELIGEISRAADVRAAVCDAARVVARASASVLLERDPGGQLVATAAAGASVDGLVLEPDAGAPAMGVLGSGRGVVLGEPSDRLDAGLLAALGRPACVALEPVVGPGVAGVLVVALGRGVERRRETLALLAAEAASAIGRADVLAELEGLARIDPLTGLLNRRAWDEALGAALARARRDGQPLSVAVLDLDGFKQFNDAHGHQAGDRLLKEVADAWRAQLREGDLLARWGGDEFALLIHDRQAGAQRVVERLQDSSRGPSASAGIAEWDGVEGADQLLSRADAALYASKGAGSTRRGDARS
jgi:diguanylate cyclase (GGDEF)-like protein